MSKNVVAKYKLIEKCDCSDRQHLKPEYHSEWCRYRIWLEAKLERHRLAYLKELDAVRSDAGKSG